MVSKILSALLNGILSWLKSEYDKEKAKANEWNLESQKTLVEGLTKTKQAEKYINAPLDTQGTRSLTDWNTGLGGLNEHESSL